MSALTNGVLNLATRKTLSTGVMLQTGLMVYSLWKVTKLKSPQVGICTMILKVIRHYSILCCFKVALFSNNLKKVKQSIVTSEPSIFLLPMVNFILELKMIHLEEMPKSLLLVITTLQQLFSTKLLKQETRLSL